MSHKITHKPKPCAVCGILFKKSLHESGVRFKAKRYCGYDCAMTARVLSRPKRADEPLKACLFCGSIMQMRDKEEARHYKVRKTCNKNCGYALQRRKAGSISGGHVQAG